ncbi:hypothetical protein C7M84_014527 [Penaeus vannamei]|uniref:Uncharacterized protein n=1 Tax=Penaeus vannamei TaxID=6689 RepID=A0A423ST72_PENVA|nr:hypothetical protein C7M84_014527 [Penaeus vannamei]
MGTSNFYSPQPHNPSRKQIFPRSPFLLLSLPFPLDIFLSLCLSPLPSPFLDPQSLMPVAPSPPPHPPFLPLRVIFPTPLPFYFPSPTLYSAPLISNLFPRSLSFHPFPSSPFYYNSPLWQFLFSPLTQNYSFTPPPTPSPSISPPQHSFSSPTLSLFPYPALLVELHLCCPPFVHPFPSPPFLSPPLVLSLLIADPNPYLPSPSSPPLPLSFPCSCLFFYPLTFLSNKFPSLTSPYSPLPSTSPFSLFTPPPFPFFLPLLALPAHNPTLTPRPIPTPTPPPPLPTPPTPLPTIPSPFLSSPTVLAPQPQTNSTTYPHPPTSTPPLPHAPSSHPHHPYHPPPPPPSHPRPILTPHHPYHPPPTPHPTPIPREPQRCVSGDRTPTLILIVPNLHNSAQIGAATLNAYWKDASDLRDTSILGIANGRSLRVPHKNTKQNRSLTRNSPQHRLVRHATQRIRPQAEATRRKYEAEPTATRPIGVISHRART